MSLFLTSCQPFLSTQSVHSGMMLVLPVVVVVLIDNDDDEDEDDGDVDGCERAA